LALFHLAHLTRINIGRGEGATFHSVPLSGDLASTHSGGSKKKFMLTSRDNTRGRQKAAGEVGPVEEAGKWLTRPGLAAAVRVSVSTIDRMVASEELPCARLRGRVRFYLPDVVEALRKGNRKFGRGANGETLKAETLKADIGVGKEEKHCREKAQRPQRTERTQGA